ncbi:hypothetical protein PUN28_017382 [Cardiocondyla obscurior]|uniref:Uncharacterized protein n=1 Tax=Cardiocondyla obscurior TaxID=286306 RepID=A0AAW2ELF8_9HYME
MDNCLAITEVRITFALLPRTMHLVTLSPGPILICACTARYTDLKMTSPLGSIKIIRLHYKYTCLMNRMRKEKKKINPMRTGSAK